MPVDHVVATLAFLGQEFERLFGANTDFDREMLRNVFDSVDRNKAPAKWPRISMNQPWLLILFLTNVMTSCCSYDMNEHEECRNVTSHQFFFWVGVQTCRNHCWNYFWRQIQNVTYEVAHQVCFLPWRAWGWYRLRCRIGRGLWEGWDCRFMPRLTVDITDGFFNQSVADMGQLRSER